MSALRFYQPIRYPTFTAYQNAIDFWRDTSTPWTRVCMIIKSQIRRKSVCFAPLRTLEVVSNLESMPQLPTIHFLQWFPETCRKRHVSIPLTLSSLLAFNDGHFIGDWQYRVTYHSYFAFSVPTLNRLLGLGIPSDKFRFEKATPSHLQTPVSLEFG